MSANNNNTAPSFSELPAETVHGFLSSKSWPFPKLVASSTQANRADQKNMILANEYLDSPEIVDKKTDLVVDLIKKSKFCGAYTGAGLSRAAGIGDYASKASNSIVNTTPKVQNSLHAKPTTAHYSLTALEKAGYLKWYVQQNHDGLPQKSGFPQHKLNEIHGAWFDPSNPVVQFSGNLRGDLFSDMEELEQKADLCLTLGTSLSGMNADRMANTPAKRSLANKKTKDGHPVLGTVLINIQQTPLDARCAVRIWAKLDDVFSLILKKLNLSISIPKPPVFPTDFKFKVPYTAEGKLSKTESTILDLSPNAPIIIPVEGAMNEGCLGKILKYNKQEGYFSVEIQEKSKGPPAFQTRIRCFGDWWVTEALQGLVPQLPLVNYYKK